MRRLTGSPTRAPRVLAALWALWGLCGCVVDSVAGPAIDTAGRPLDVAGPAADASGGFGPDAPAPADASWEPGPLDVGLAWDVGPLDAADMADAPDAPSDAFTSPDTTAPADTTAPPDTPEPADTPTPADAPTPEDTPAPDDTEGEPPCPSPRPILLVHGINGSSENYALMAERLVSDGWPPDYVYLFDAADPAWGCNVDNAAAIAALVATMMAETGHDRIDLVAHSMGALSTRYWVKNLGGADLVNTFVILGGMNHGLWSSCLAPDFLGVCVWQEICQWGAFVAQLNEDPATPGALHWVSMYGTADTVIPNSSSELEGAENIAFDGVEHSGPDGLLEVPEVYDEVLRVLDYPCW